MAAPGALSTLDYRLLTIDFLAGQVGERPVLLVLVPVDLKRVGDQLDQLLDLEAEMGALELQVLDRLLDLGGALERVMGQPLARVLGLLDDELGFLPRRA